MIPPSPDHKPTEYDDDWEDAPASGWFPKWVWGIAVPLLLTGYAVVCLITGHAVVRNHYSVVHWYGVKAVAYGLALASIGVFLHCHYFWGNIYHLSAWAVLGKIISMMAFIGCVGYLFYRVLLWG